MAQDRNPTGQKTLVLFVVAVDGVFLTQVIVKATHLLFLWCQFVVDFGVVGDGS
jgi:hypothetical protein